MRLAFLFMASFLIWCNSAIGRDANDKIDSILEFIVRMSGKMDKLTGTVEKLSKTEEISMEKIVKLEEAVLKIEKKEGAVEKWMGNITQKMDSNHKEENAKLQKLDNSTLISSLMSAWEPAEKGNRGIWEDHNSVSAALMKGWKYYGIGCQVYDDDYIYKFPKTFAECVQMCDEKRSTDGEDWNGMAWGTF